jgi:hypothetical protein
VKVTRRSTTGYVITHHGTPLVWFSKRQSVVACSSAEAEYVALAEAVKELMWLRNFCTEVFGRSGAPVNVPIYSDSQSALAISERDGSDSRTKHIDVKYHLVKSQVDIGACYTQWIHTSEQVADLLTKPVAPISQFEFLRSKLLVPSPVATRSNSTISVISNDETTMDVATDNVTVESLPHSSTVATVLLCILCIYFPHSI